MSDNKVTMTHTLEALRLFDESAPAREAAWQNLTCNADAEAAYKADQDALQSLRLAYYEDTKGWNNKDNCLMLNENTIRYWATGKPRANSINIGAVDFAHLTGELNGDGSPKFIFDLNIMGDERVKLLTMVYEGKPLPEGLVLTGNFGPTAIITPEAIHWASSGIPQRG